MHSAVALHLSAHAQADEALAGQPDVLISPEDSIRYPDFSCILHPLYVPGPLPEDAEGEEEKEEEEEEEEEDFVFHPS